MLIFDYKSAKALLKKSFDYLLCRRSSLRIFCVWKSSTMEVASVITGEKIKRCVYRHIKKMIRAHNAKRASNGSK